MTSVERVVEYTELKSEAPWKSQQEPPSDWPNKGQVTFSHVNLSYSPNGPLALKDISFSFQPSEKVRDPDHMQLHDGLYSLIFCKSGWRCGSNWRWKEFSGLCSVTPNGA